jgi:hypothetical protein
MLAKPDTSRTRHRRTISKTAEDLLKIISIPTPNSDKLHPVSPTQLSEGLKHRGMSKTSEKCLKQISEEETHIRSLIEQRKHFSTPSIANLSPIYPIKSKAYVEKVSFNSSTTAYNSLEENGLNHIIEVLEAIKPPEFLEIKSLIIDLLERSPEPHFTLILDCEKNIKGIYYIEQSTGYFHKVIASSDLSMIIPIRKVWRFFNFDLEENRFLPCNKEKFDAVILK